MGEEMFCENCGAKTNDDEFCSNCGVKKKSTPPKGKATPSKATQTAPIVTKEAVDVDAQNSKPHVLNYISLAASGVLLLGGIVYASATEQRIKELEERVDYLDSSIAYLESDISNTQDWAYDEFDSVANCVNEFIDSWSQWLPAYDCLPPAYPY